MVRKLDAGTLEQAQKAKYGSEKKNVHTPDLSPSAPDNYSGVIKPLPGRKAEGYQTLLDPNQVALWEGNPRNFERDVDISELRELLQSSGGNTEAVTATIIEGKITVIAGRSRRQGCIEESLPLLVNVFNDLTDEECHFIADAENRGRKDLSQVAYCQYLAHRFDELSKSPSKSLSVAEFAQNYKLKRQAMQDKISVGRLPRFLFDSVASMDSWGMRQLLAVRSLYNQLKEQPDITDSKIETAIGGCKVPTAVISELESFLPSAKDSDPTKRSISVGQGEVEIKKSHTGILTVKCDSKVDVAIREKLEAFVYSLSEN